MKAGLKSRGSPWVLSGPFHTILDPFSFWTQQMPKCQEYDGFVSSALQEDWFLNPPYHTKAFRLIAPIPAPRSNVPWLLQL